MFDTAKGVGFAGNVAADTKKPRRGLPIWILVAVCVAMCIAAPIFVIGLMRYVSHSVAFRPGKMLSGLGRTNAPGHGAKENVTSEQTNAPAVSAAPVPATNDLAMVGFALIPAKGYAVMLSDGRTLYTSKRQVLFVDENRCVVDGAWVYRRILPPLPPTSPTTSIAADIGFHAPASGSEFHGPG